MNHQQEQIIQAYEDFTRKVQSIMGAACPVSINIYDTPESAFSVAAEKHETATNKWTMESPTKRIVLFSQCSKANNEEAQS